MFRMDSFLAFLFGIKALRIRPKGSKHIYFVNYIQQDDALSNVNSLTNPKHPVGYHKAKVHSRCILLRALVDLGNLFADLISEELAKLLKLPIQGSTLEVGTHN